jgi:hypothetical protein
LQWSYLSQAVNGSGALGTEIAITADARFPSLQVQLVATAQAAGCSWNGQIVDWRSWEPTECRTQAWNTVMHNMTAVGE